MSKKIIALIIATMVCFSGCTPAQTSIDQLITPPKLSEQQTKIYEALETVVGKSIKLKYPVSGEHTSAFLINNLDLEQTDEAIVFYETQNSAKDTMPLGISVLDQKEAKWVSTYETRVEANEVEKVTFVKTGDKTHIIIGFNQTTGQKEKLVNQYMYNEGVLRLISSTRCNNYEVFDINGDSNRELITITTKTLTDTQKTSTATVYDIIDTGLLEIDSTNMDPTVSSYINVKGGKLIDGSPALYLDGVKSANVLSTEILILNKDNLKNLIYNQDENRSKVSKTLRGAGSLSLDFDKQDVFYIPISNPAPGYDGEAKTQTYSFTSWYAYKKNRLELMQNSYVDYKLGFIFTLPSTWGNKVTIEKITSENEVIFYKYTGDIRDKSKKILSIKAVKKVDYLNVANESEHRILKDNGQLLYLYYIYDSIDITKISEAQVRECFNLLHGGRSNEENPGM